ncbi:hypothetical protein FC697_21555 [Bacillus wiedmannii]|uniref:Uncharacterized protein n=1 Tax=Bacillus mycoides TaxID=1405 RepID=A0A1S9SZT3_BACMY|nr:hypothetical protein [Bacillus mycoides]PRD03303.1 hypothetical protein CQ058_31080 [Bacillus sp. MYb56]RAN70635.1 hypothetical protein B5P40_15360 [Bacillus sp. SRB_8]TKH18055.1 hypothetical protein FC697_21555 [Bacillus wiedmannii]MBG9685382.1 hypothetical protein [Bacillus mycoides]
MPLRDNLHIRRSSRRYLPSSYLLEVELGKPYIICTLYSKDVVRQNDVIEGMGCWKKRKSQSRKITGTHNCANSIQGKKTLMMQPERVQTSNRSSTRKKAERNFCGKEGI